MAGYLTLGFGFGILLSTAGYSWIWALVMSAAIYAGAMQYLAVGILVSSPSLVSIAITTFLVNCRHMFYGISLIDKYKNAGKKKPYMIFALTDETYSLLVRENPAVKEKDRISYYFYVSLFDQIYWIVGSVAGAAAGMLIPFDSTGIEFTLTALFITIFTEQWLSTKDHRPAAAGVVSTIISLLIFGSDNLLIPAMILILICLLSMRKFDGKEQKNE